MILTKKIKTLMQEKGIENIFMETTNYVYLKHNGISDEDIIKTILNNINTNNISNVTDEDNSLTPITIINESHSITYRKQYLFAIAYTLEQDNLPENTGHLYHNNIIIWNNDKVNEIIGELDDAGDVEEIPDYYNNSKFYDDMYNEYARSEYMGGDIYLLCTTKDKLFCFPEDDSTKLYEYNCITGKKTPIKYHKAIQDLYDCCNIWANDKNQSVSNTVRHIQTEIGLKYIDLLNEGIFS